MVGGGTLPASLCAVAIIAGIVLLRLGWRRGGSGLLGLTTLGWAVLTAGLVPLTAWAGAWGLAVGAMAAMLTALLLLGHAALTSPRGRERPARDIRPTILLRPNGAIGLARRVAVFMMVVPISFAAAALIALAIQALARASGWAEANSTTLGLLLFPIAWTALATILVMQTRLSSMLKPLAGSTLVAAATLWLAT